uniref:Uncharacterized protein n=1 Tax=Rhizophora mucronata TaxID=61149 RepID=A0A2P2P7Z8_RHIMU
MRTPPRGLFSFLSNFLYFVFMILNLCPLLGLFLLVPLVLVS